MYAGRVNAHPSFAAPWALPIRRTSASANRLAMIADCEKRFAPPVPFENDETELTGIDPALHSLFSEQPIHQSSEPTAPHEIRKVLTDGAPDSAEDASDFFQKLIRDGRLRAARGVETDGESSIEILAKAQLENILEAHSIAKHRGVTLPARANEGDGGALEKTASRQRVAALTEWVSRKLAEGLTIAELAKCARNGGDEEIADIIELIGRELATAA